MGRKRKLPEGMWDRDGIYYARFRANGREVRKRLSSNFRAACEMLNDLKARADRAEFDLLDNDYSFAALKLEFVTWVRQTKRRPGEYERHLRSIEEYSAISRVRQLDHNFVVGYRNWRATPRTIQQDGKAKVLKGMSPRTINIEVGTLRNMLNKGVEWKRIGSNPLSSVKGLRHDTPVKQRRPLTVAEVLRLFEVSPEYLKPVWRMFMCTGIRRNELVSLLFSDIDFARGAVLIRAAVAKNGKAREIPLDDGMLAMLKGLKLDADQRKPGATNFSRKHVFVSKANTPLKNNLLTRFYSTCTRAGIEDGQRGGSVDIHSLRVSFTTLSIEGGANPKAVQAILGHSTLAMTMNVYSRATERSKRDAISALPFATVSAPEHVIPVQNAHSVRTGKNRASQSNAG